MAIGEEEGLAAQARRWRWRERSCKRSALPPAGMAVAHVGEPAAAVFAGSRAAKRSRVGLAVSLSDERELREMVPRVSSVVGRALW